MNGQEIGGYTLETPLGKGTYGEVWKATKNGQNFALKIFKGQLPEEAQQEHAQLLRVEHPHIINEIEIGHDQGNAFLVLEYLEGESLKTAKCEDYTVEEWTRFAHQLASGLQHAHQQSLVHRDVKPDNVHITSDKQIKILDFGTATTFTINPLERKLMGSYLYMAPEQVNGKINAQNDIWGYGITLYEFLTGVNPMAAQTVGELSEKILASPIIPPHRLNPAIPLNLSYVIVNCLQKNLKKRYGSFDEIIGDLERDGLEERMRELAWPIRKLSPAAAFQRHLNWIRRYNQLSSYNVLIPLQILNGLAAIGLLFIVLCFTVEYLQSEAEVWEIADNATTIQIFQVLNSYHDFSVDFLPYAIGIGVVFFTPYFLISLLIPKRLTDDKSLEEALELYSFALPSERLQEIISAYQLRFDYLLEIKRATMTLALEEEKLEAAITLAEEQLPYAPKDFTLLSIKAYHSYLTGAHDDMVATLAKILRVNRDHPARFFLDQKIDQATSQVQGNNHVATDQMAETVAAESLAANGSTSLGVGNSVYNPLITEVRRAGKKEIRVEVQYFNEAYTNSAEGHIMLYDTYFSLHGEVARTFKAADAKEIEALPKPSKPFRGTVVLQILIAIATLIAYLLRSSKKYQEDKQKEEENEGTTFSFALGGAIGYGFYQFYDGLFVNDGERPSEQAFREDMYYQIPYQDITKIALNGRLLETEPTGIMILNPILSEGTTYTDWEHFLTTASSIS